MIFTFFHYKELMSNEWAGNYSFGRIKTGHLTKSVLIARDYFPLKIHSALSSETVTCFLWRHASGEIYDPKSTAKHFLEKVSEWPV